MDYQGRVGEDGQALTKKELTQNPASARLARPVLDSDTAEIIRGGNEAKSGTEPKQRMWNVFLDPEQEICKICH